MKSKIGKMVTNKRSINFDERPRCTRWIFHGRNWMWHQTALAVSKSVCRSTSSPQK